jgi:hypothetical protein
MRSTSLLLPALVVTALSASAATSSNIVGYVKVNLNAGFNLVANQLDNGAGNKVVDLFKAPLPEGFTVFKFNGASYVSISFVDGTWEGDDLNMVAAPGEGVFVRNSGGASTVTFVGEVKTGTSTVALAGGNKFSIVSSVIPQQIKLSDAGFPATEGDSVFRFNGASYASDSFVDGTWEGDSGGSAPTVKVGEAFFVRNAGADAAWSRNFVVN